MLSYKNRLNPDYIFQKNNLYFVVELLPGPLDAEFYLYLRSEKIQKEFNMEKIFDLFLRNFFLIGNNNLRQ